MGPGPVGAAPRRACRAAASAAGCEPASGYNLPPGCLDSDIERAYGAGRHRCGECMHCIESDALGCLVCAVRLAGAVAGLDGARRRSPECILAAVEGAATDEGDCCAYFEG